jgi:hypothetical protein
MIDTTIQVPPGKNLTVFWTSAVVNNGDDLVAVTEVPFIYWLGINGNNTLVTDTLTVDGNENPSGLVTSSMKTVSGLSGNIPVTLGVSLTPGFGEAFGSISTHTAQMFLVVW